MDTENDARFSAANGNNQVASDDKYNTLQETECDVTLPLLSALENFQQFLRKCSFRQSSALSIRQRTWVQDNIKMMQADEKLFRSNEIPLTSLLEMPERDAKLAVRMAFHITQWIETSNDRWDIEIRDKLIDSIYETTFKQKILRAELYLQLLNQTAGSMHLFREFNTWALWIQLAKLIECCSDLRPLMIEYWKVIAGNDRCCCAYVKWTACCLLRRHDQRSISVTILPRIYRHRITLSDKSKEEMIYDGATKVSDVVLYISWVIGLKNHKSFALYQTNNGHSQQLDLNLSFKELVDTVKSQKQRSATFLMKSPLLELSDDHLNDPMMIRLMYHQAQFEYIRMFLPLEAKIIVALCVFQLMAEGRLWLSEYSEALDQILPSLIPAQHFGLKDAEWWTQKIIQSSKELLPLSVECAQIAFVNKIHELNTKQSLNLDYGHSPGTKPSTSRSITCGMKRVPKNGSVKTPLRTNPPSPENFGLDCLHDFERSPCECGERQFNDSPFEKRENIEKGLQAMEISIPSFSQNVSVYNSAWTKNTTEGTPVVHHSRNLKSSVERNEIQVDDQFFRVPKRVSRTPSTSSISLTNRDPEINNSESDFKSLGTGRENRFVKKSQSTGEISVVETDSNIVDDDSSHQTVDLASLRKGECLNKYTILSSVSDGIPKVRLAKNDSGDEVLLHFFQNKTDFERVKKIHQMLENSQYICKLEDDFEVQGWFCQVFRKGDMTLKQWMERDSQLLRRKAALFDILMALMDLKEQRILHRDLNPNHIVWSGTQCKFQITGFHKAVVESEFGTNDWITKYGDSDVISIMGSKGEKISLDPSIDMWSFGLIAYEVMTGNELVKRDGSDAVDITNDFLQEKLRLVKGCETRKFFVDLIQINPLKRPTPEEALQNLYMSVESISGNDPESMHIARNREEYNFAGSIQRIYEEISTKNLLIQINVEEFKTSKDEKETFHTREATQVPTTRDLDLSNDNKQEEMIHLLTIDKSYRIRVQLWHRRLTTLPFDEIKSIRIKLSDCEAVSLQMESLRSDALEFEAVALLDPSLISSRVLKSVSPITGPSWEKYVRLDIFLAMIDKNNKNVFETYSPIYLRMFSKKHKLRGYRLGRAFLEKWTHSPCYAKTVVRSVHQGIQFVSALSCFLP